MVFHTSPSRMASPPRTAAKISIPRAFTSRFTTCLSSVWPISWAITEASSSGESVILINSEKTRIYPPGRVTAFMTSLFTTRIRCWYRLSGSFSRSRCLMLSMALSRVGLLISGYFLLTSSTMAAPNFSSRSTEIETASFTPDQSKYWKPATPASITTITIKNSKRRVFFICKGVRV